MCLIQSFEMQKADEVLRSVNRFEGVDYRVSVLLLPQSAYTDHPIPEELVEIECPRHPDWEPR